MSEWNEADHPRDADGKFGAGGGTLVLSSGGAMGQTLPDNESMMDSIDKYTGDGYKDINGGLRNAGGDLSRLPVDLATHVANMDAAFQTDAAQPMSEYGTRYVYRGVSVQTKELYELDRLVPGDQINDQGYMSTSRELGTALDFVDSTDGAVLEITCPPDLRAIEGSPMESELILNRGTTIEYTGKSQQRGATVYEFRYVSERQAPFA